MRVQQILEHFLSRADWVDREHTVDRVIAGDPDADVDRCLVTWMPSRAALQHAVAAGLRLVICHEPTFWNHHDERRADDPAIADKEAFVRDHGLTILRNHDAWDRWPQEGIPWAWARFLGLGQQPVATGAAGYQHRYDLPARSLESFAAQVAACCAPLGEPLVQVTGNLDQSVSRVGIGTGCGCDLRVYQQLGCDCSLVCDDGSCYWAGIQRARDLGHPVIRVNHGTSEEPGMVTLAGYINQHLDGLTAEHLPHGSLFRLVGGEGAKGG